MTVHESNFKRSEDDKARRLAQVRRRLAAATPAPQRTPRRFFADADWDWPRTAKAAVLVAILVLAIVAGSGVFG